MKVAVIGGGPAGMMSAIVASKNGHDVILIEKNEKLGKKLYITGKGRCNLTNDSTPFEFLENVVNNSKFLISAINTFTPTQTMAFFEENGLKLKVERGNRVFPLSDKASDVTKTLEKVLLKNNVKIFYNETVVEIIAIDNKISKIVTNLSEYQVDCVIIATGGITYSTTGSTGDGFLFAKKMGHNVIEPKPALVGIELKDDFYLRVQGLSLKNVGIRLYRGDKLIYSETGEMLFTHYGISGPLILTSSSIIARDDIYNIKMFLDLKVGLSSEQLDNRILRDFNEFKGKTLSNSLDKLLPKSFVNEVITKAGLKKDKKNSEITVEERQKLVFTLKNFPLKLKKLRGENEAIITSGGVSVKEINPKTMESKKIKGLFFAGEVIDVDAFTGGYNIQLALSTGYMAGNGIN